MPVIPEDSVMEEFVNWDHAEPPASSANVEMPFGTNLDLQPVQDNLDFDLALANIDGDDFSFWALEHFETSNFDSIQAQAQTTTEPASGAAALAVCDACQASGFTCKRVKEGQYEGYCTSCVALRHNCSFGLASPTDNKTSGPFPTNPWPIRGESPSGRFPEQTQQDNPRSHSSPDLASSTAGTESGKDNSPKPPAVPKIGARFSRESVRILKAWLSTHSNRPYPSEDEREALQRQTGLNKTQIANWLANARRRSKGKYQPTRSTSPSVRGFSGAIEIPHRRGTPVLEHMNPLQRWENSPPGIIDTLGPLSPYCANSSPENEPASVTAIASAILNNANSSNGSGLNSPYSLNFTDDDADKSCSPNTLEAHLDPSGHSNNVDAGGGGEELLQDMETRRLA
ncbi:Homeobox protein 4 [Cytospora mali]|uniref:Homeobox protein 4 n=1 Tax=Cytospora mali TaxID=578113 RepID=A0A194UU78_CYTMA|nr:Homeobox protein 4 [Valsa mali var. pyri (nom. inval.)]